MAHQLTPGMVNDIYWKTQTKPDRGTLQARVRVGAQPQTGHGCCFAALSPSWLCRVVPRWHVPRRVLSGASSFAC